MFELLLVPVGIFLAVTVAASLEYYRLVRRAREEYEKAREIVSDIVLSFDRDLKKESEKLVYTISKIEGLTSKSESVITKTSHVEKQLVILDSRVTAASSDNVAIITRLNETDHRLRDVTASQEAVTSKITSIEELAKLITTTPEPNVEAVIPIRRDKALAPLTETELSALEVLASDGPKTAPEMKEKIKLSREHTARLMKRLYESGYLERDTGKIPFRYSVKKEMERLLKKASPEAV